MTKKEHIISYVEQILNSIGFDDNTNFTMRSNSIEIEVEDGLYTLLLLQPNEKEIIWSTKDFKDRAIELTEKHNKLWREVYDENKFQDALDQMIHDMDCNFGISWNTVDTYLEEYCKIKKDE